MIHPQNKMSLKGKPTAWKGGGPTPGALGAQLFCRTLGNTAAKPPRRWLPFNPLKAAQLLKALPGLPNHWYNKAFKAAAEMLKFCLTLWLAQKLAWPSSSSCKKKGET